MQKIFGSETEDELYPVADEIKQLSDTNKIFAFFGEMGAGKTTLIKKICDRFNVQDYVSSPTFSLVNEYITADDNLIYHFDFYRIKSTAEAVDIGFDEYLYSGNLCFIEWPEKVESLLPEETIKVQIIPQTNRRKIIINI